MSYFFFLGGGGGGGNVTHANYISPPDKSVYWKTIFFITHQKNHLNDTVLLSTETHL